MLSAERICRQLKKTLPLTVLETTESTSLVARELATANAASGTVVLASAQTAGRGRLGRTFFSPNGGLYMSILLRPKMAPDATLAVTTAAAVEVLRALNAFCTESLTVKWVNDIYLGDRKICGILTEGIYNTDTAAFDAVILGIGVNLTEPSGGFPSEIADRAGTLFGQTAVTDEQKETVAAAILNAFFERYSDTALQSSTEEYRRHSYLDGKTVTYLKDGVSHTGKVLGVDEKVRLILEENGKTVFLEAGEVSVVPQNNE